MAHSLFAPSAAHRWMACPGSMTFVDPTLPETDGGPWAAEGTAAHTLASRALEMKRDCSFWIGEEIQVGERVFKVDDDMAMHTQVYVDYVRDRAAKGHMLIEQWVDLTQHYGTEAGGTLDAGVAASGELDVIDLKFGRGVQVYAEHNAQLMSYALGALDLLDMFGPFTKINLTIVQPRLDHIDVWSTTVEELSAFATAARTAVQNACDMLAGECAPVMIPGESQCRWCPGKSDCPALTDKIQRDMEVEFATINTVEFIPASKTNADLALKYSAIPLIQSWCKAVADELRTRVLDHQQIIGEDGKPFKIVQGKPGNMAWTDKDAASQLLTAQIAEKAYEPPCLITPSAAKKALGKKRINVWTDVLAPLTIRADGKATLVPGSDPRDAFTPAAGAAEFDTGEDNGDANE